MWRHERDMCKLFEPFSEEVARIQNPGTIIQTLLCPRAVRMRLPETSIG
jgi:hypothetical protein